MNGDQLFIDSNIILYYLNGDKTLLPVLACIIQVFLQNNDFMQCLSRLSGLTPTYAKGIPLGEKVRFWERSEASRYFGILVVTSLQKIQ